MSTTTETTVDLSATETTVDLSAVAEFIRQTDRVAALAAQVTAAEALLQQLEPLAYARLPEDGSLLVIEVDGATRTATRGQKVSVKQTASDADAVAFAQLHNLKTSTRSAETLPHATLRSAALKGVDVSDIAEVTKSPIVVIG